MTTKETKWEKEKAMISLKEALNILKIASGKGNYPIYSSYLHSDGKEIASSGYDTYARFSFKLPFRGDIELSLIEKYLLLEDVKFKNTDKLLEIEFNNTRTRLNIQHFDFPYQYKPNKDGIILDHNIINIIKEALKYAGNSAPFIYLCNKYIFSGDKSAIFRHKINLDIDTPIFFNREYVKVLKNECKLFSNKNVNFVEYENGFFCFVKPSKKFNIDPLVAQMDNSKKGSKFICDISYLKEGLKNIEPIFQGEIEKEVRVKSENGRIKLIGESYINGVADTWVDIGVETEFDFMIDSKFIKNISLDYYLYKPKMENRLLFVSESSNSDILVVVEDK